MTAAMSQSRALGVRVSILDAEVEKLRGGTVGHLQGCAVEIPEIEPWPEPVEGAETLDAVAAAIARCVAVRLGAADAIARCGRRTPIVFRHSI